MCAEQVHTIYMYSQLCMGGWGGGGGWSVTSRHITCICLIAARPPCRPLLRNVTEQNKQDHVCVGLFNVPWKTYKGYTQYKMFSIISLDRSSHTKKKKIIIIKYFDSGCSYIPKPKTLNNTPQLLQQNLHHLSISCRLKILNYSLKMG